MVPLRCRITASANSLASRFAGALVGLGAPKQVFLEGASCPELTGTGAAMAQPLVSADVTPPLFVNTTFLVDKKASTLSVAVSVKDQGVALSDEVAVANLYISETGALKDAVAVNVTGLLNPATGELRYSHTVTPGVEYSYWLVAVDRAGNSTQEVYLGKRDSNTPLAGSSGTANASGDVVFNFSLV